MDSIYKELIDMLDLEIQDHLDSDGMLVYNYIDVPELESLNTSTLVRILKMLDIHIPFDESFPLLNNATDIIFKQGLDDKDKKALEKISKGLIEVKENRIHFKDRSESREAIIDLLELYNIHSGTIILDHVDNEPDYAFLRDEYYLSEYEEFMELNLSYFEVIDEIQKIREECNKSSADVVRKSLVIAAFSQVESFYKSLIVKRLPKFENFINNKYIRTIVVKNIDKQLNAKENRNKFFKELYNVKNSDFHDLPEDHHQIRNGLAHDIGSVSIIDNNLEYTTPKNERIYVGIDTIFDSILNFIIHINQIEIKNPNYQLTETDNDSYNNIEDNPF
ncbi:hypothetical protein [Enterococcus mundtii]|uniref:hypothetical protein n=1 Tax=Enterococcus mundtii TaxID=53346 RepID=UPI001A9595EB|nr:hypothetical protein [Enterococcus mundtii]MBO1087223.1 hypothetical protein [Enterococcus mundtii]